MKKQDKDYVKEELRKFSEAMQESYEKDNLIKAFCTINEFSEDEEEFIQIGRRIALPKEFFLKEEGVHKDNSVIAGDFIRALVNEEKNFILREIINSKNIKKVSICQFNYSELCKMMSNFKNPTDIFFPIEPFFKKIHYMGYENPKNVKFVSGLGPVLLFKNEEIKIHWITSHEEINKIIVINKEELKITQKNFDNSKSPKGVKIIKDYEEFSKGKKLMLYFGEKDNKNFDFIYRTIISKPYLNTDSAMLIDFQNSGVDK